MPVDAAVTQPMGHNAPNRQGPPRKAGPTGPVRKLPLWLILMAALIAVAHAGAIAYGISTGGAYVAFALFGGLMLAGLGAVAYVGTDEPGTGG